jgi:hypothetical protein
MFERFCRLGFQTHNTPVLLAHGERAELATDSYIPISPVLEGLVILKPNPKSKGSFLCQNFTIFSKFLILFLFSFFFVAESKKKKE